MQLKNKQPIGIYDSGIGGLTVLKALQHALPHEDFVYFADTANLPYGDKSADEILGFSSNIVEWMIKEKQVKLVVAACNTSSAIALDLVQSQVNIPLIGTIHPLLKSIQKHHLDSSFGVLATPASIKSRTHERLLRASGVQGAIQSIPCPLFVPYIEAGDYDHPALIEAAKTYLEPFLNDELKTLIFGCTHYPWITPLIQSLIPAHVTLLDPAHSMVEEVLHHLVNHDMTKHSTDKGTTQFHCSDNAPHFEANLKRLLGLKSKATLTLLKQRITLQSDL